MALAVALAVRGPRLGHVYVDLATIRETAAVDADEPVDLSALPWPDRRASGSSASRRSPLVAVGEDDAAEPAAAPGRHRRSTSTATGARSARSPPTCARSSAAPAGDVDDDVLADGLDAAVPGRDRRAASAWPRAAAVLRRFAVVAGGPGTGKTTTVARIVALLAEQAAAAGDAAAAGRARRARPARPPPASRRRSTRRPPALDVSDAVRAQLLALAGLDAAPPARLAPGQPQPLPPRPRQPPAARRRDRRRDLDGLALADGEAGRGGPADARLVLVGDPGQLTSIEAGAVLGDIVGPPRRAAMRAGARSGDRHQSRRRPPPGARRRRHRRARPRPPLRRRHRALAARSRATPTRSELLADPPDERRRGSRSTPRASRRALAPVRDGAVAAARAVDRRGPRRRRAGRRSRRSAASASCARTAAGPTASRPGRRGSRAGWRPRSTASAPRGRWYVGRPLLVTENDYGLRLYNGDTGVVVADRARRA